MPYRVNHIHLKSPDPKKTADWYVKAFNLVVDSDMVRPSGDRFIRCKAEDGSMAINISGARGAESMGNGDAMPHWGLEHFGFDSVDLDADIARLESIGAKLLERPAPAANGVQICFVQAPDNVRIELIQQPKG